MAMTGTTFTQRRLKPLSRLCLMLMLVVFSLCIDQVVLFVLIHKLEPPEGTYFEDCSAADQMTRIFCGHQGSAFSSSLCVIT